MPSRSLYFASGLLMEVVEIMGVWVNLVLIIFWIGVGPKQHFSRFCFSAHRHVSCEKVRGKGQVM